MLRRSHVHIWLDNVFEVCSRGFDIHRDGFLLDLRIVDDDHDVGAGCELVNYACELLVFYNHRLELEVGLNAWQFELLDYIGDFFKSMHVFMPYVVVVGDHQESRLFEENDFVGVNSLSNLF